MVRRKAFGLGPVYEISARVSAIINEVDSNFKPQPSDAKSSRGGTAAAVD
jgi:hypothetical protein